MAGLLIRRHRSFTAGFTALTFVLGALLIGVYLGLHAYVAAVEPAQMAHLTTFPQAIVALGYAHLPHRQLADFEQLYANMEPPNFAWYQCQLHLAAHRIYDAGGLEAVQALFRAIVQSQDDISNERLAVQLRDAVHPTVAQVLTTWPDLEFSEP